MPSLKHQVLVLVPNDPDLLPTSWPLPSLKTLLTPHYTVQSVTSKTIVSEPWEDNCSLLVLPSKTSLEREGGWGYKVASRIESFVQSGGSYIGVGWSLGQLPQGDLAVEGTSTSWTAGQQIQELKLSGITQSSTATIPLATKSGQALSALLPQNSGKAIFLSTPFFQSLASHPAAAAILTELLTFLGIRLPSSQTGAASTSVSNRWAGVDPSLLKPTDPLPQILLSLPGMSAKTDVFHASGISEKLKRGMDGSEKLQDSNDTLHLIPTATLPSVPSYLDQSRTTSPDETVKPVLLPGDAAWEKEWTPLFDFGSYWKALDRSRKIAGIKGGDGKRLGDVVLYGEAVTSTQTMLDKNPILLHNLPAPLVSMASFQLSGRGRGSNQWLSPPGCLQFSILLSLPASFPAGKLVFVQYLMALAACEGLDDDGKLGVKIKWPNDIYAEAEGVGAAQAPAAEGERAKKGRAKLGGILVNSSFQNGEWRLVVGCGINILNDLPTTSIAQLTELADARENRQEKRKASMEESFAKILTSFDSLWERFVSEEGFEGFMDEYLGRWLHTDQEVTLMTVEPNIPLRIESITLDGGLLRCVRLDRGKTGAEGFGMGNLSLNKPEYVDLQPDGNSFDLMAGLIRRKL